MKIIGLALLFCVGTLVGAVESPTAASIAADIIRARAQTCDTETARQLRQLADGVETGRIDLTQAKQVMELAAQNPAKSVVAPPKATSAKDVTALLDADRPASPPPTVEETKVEEEMSDAPPAAPKIATTVLAISPAGGDKPSLIMIGAGEKTGVKAGDRFLVRRSLKTIVTCEVTQVKEAMSVCMVIPGTFVDAHESIREGDDAISSDD